MDYCAFERKFVNKKKKTNSESNEVITLGYHHDSWL